MKTILLLTFALCLSLHAEVPFVAVNPQQTTITVAIEQGTLVRNHELVLGDGSRYVMNPQDFEIISSAVASAELITNIAPGDVPSEAKSTYFWAKYDNHAPVPLEKRWQVYFSNGTDATYVAYVAKDDFAKIAKLLTRLE